MKKVVALCCAIVGWTVSAAWITHPDMSKLTPRNVLSRQLERSKLKPVDTQYQNRHYLFRRVFEVSTVGKATLRITADDYYKLYVNGKFIGMGPAAGTIDSTYYNTIDLTPHLIKGHNTIAVHTYYQGLVNRVWVSGDNRNGLWLELNMDGKRILESDESFKVARHTGYSAMGKAGYDTQFLECYDAGAKEVGFEQPEHDDTAWVMAVEHPLGGDYVLVEQPSPMVVTERVKPVSIEQLTNGMVRLDFGGIYVGGIEFSASGKKGDYIEIRCGQELNADDSVRYKLRANCNYLERMVLSGGACDVLNQYDYKSFRYVELLPSVGASIKIDSIDLIARHQPFALKAKPTFSDPKLKPIWNLCVDSFRYGVQEQIMDCMEREKGYYLGDGCWTMMSYCVLTKDWSQARKFFDDFLRTKKVDRGLVTCANCSFMQEIAEYPFMMMLLAYWYLEETGDTAFVGERFDALVDVINSYRERYARSDGLLTNLDKWCVVEWPKNFQDGYDADVREGKICTDVHNVINAWYIIAIQSLNAIATRLGRQQYTDVKPLEKAFRKAFWDANRHLFVDREGSNHVSLPGNVYATFGCLAPKGDTTAHKTFLALVKEKGYSSISLFQFAPLFCYLRNTGEETLLHDLLVSPDAWLRILREGGTRTFEGWGRDTKWNTSLFHLTMASAVLFLTDVRMPLPGGQKPIDISKETPRYFETADGKPWIPIGCNICFDRLYNGKACSGVEVQARFNRWLRAFAANGGNCIRLWAGHRSLEVMPDKPGVYDSERAQTIKFIIALCEELGIKVKITLESFRFCLSEEEEQKRSNPKGVQFNYVHAFNRALYAPYANSVAEFFRLEECRRIYLGKAQYLKDIGLGNSRAVYCWELWNEINATSAMSDYAPWCAWALSELKKMFPRQMTVNNLGSFSDVAAYQVYDELATERDNDFMQIHRYLDAGAELDVCRGPMDVVAASAVRESLMRRPDRPAIVAEIGAVQANHAGPFKYYQVDKQGTLLHDALFAAFFAGSAGCGQFWHWDHQYIDGNNLWWHFRRFATAIDGLNPISENFHPFYTESHRLKMYGLKGKTTTIVWCRDKQSTWEYELAQGNKPEVLTNETVPFRNCIIDCYLPWEDRRLTVNAPKLPAFQRSIVVRVPTSAVDGMIRPH